MRFSSDGGLAFTWLVTQKLCSYRYGLLGFQTVAVSQRQRLIFLGAGLPRVFAGTSGTGFGLSQRRRPSGPGRGGAGNCRGARGWVRGRRREARVFCEAALRYQKFGDQEA